MLILQYSDNAFTDNNMSVSTSNRESRSNPGLSNMMYMAFPLPLCHALLLDSSLIRNDPKRIIIEEHQEKIDDHF